MLIHERIGRVLGDQLGPHQSWTQDTTLGADLDLDNVDLVELAMRLEDEFRIAIPEGDEAGWESMTVGELARYIEPLLASKSALLG